MSDLTPDTLSGIRLPAILCQVERLKGSGPREAGAQMLVGPDWCLGTIGGGHLELVSFERARAMLADGSKTDRLDVLLGPETGQCCGGRVEIRLEALNDTSLETLKQDVQARQCSQPQIMVFGAGHVGRALARALAPLPVTLKLVESRKDELDQLGEGFDTVVTPMPEALVATMRAGDAAVILTHDHGLDFLIAEQALARGDLAYVGMIGSATKRGVFLHWLEDHGHARSLTDHLVMPIGGGQVADKRPEVIAALVAAELLGALLPARG